MYSAKIKHFIKRFTVINITFVFMLSVFLQVILLLPTQKAYAASPGTVEWQSINSLIYNGKEYTYIGQNDDDPEYIKGDNNADPRSAFAEAGKSGCYDGLRVLVQYRDNKPPYITLHERSQSTAAGNTNSCIVKKLSYTPNQTNPDNAFAILLWQDKDNIVRLDGKNVSKRNNTNLRGVTYTREAGTNNFSESGGNCGDYITTDPNNPARATYTVQSTKKGEKQDIAFDTTGSLITDNSDTAIAGSTPACYKSNTPKPVVLAFPSESTKDVGSGRDDPGGAASTETTGIKDCRDELGALGWIICPVADAADAIASGLEKGLVSLLRMGDVSDTKTKDLGGIKSGWAAMRSIASVLIVLVALAMIASQIFSFEFLSAYTIKKVLPKLFIAAILIQLSWVLFTAMIAIFNAVGDSVATILYSPWPELGTAVANNEALAKTLEAFADNWSKVDPGTGDAIAKGGIITAIGGLIGFTVIGGAGGIVLGLLLIVAACCVIFITLVIRKIAIIILLVIAPLALVAWILPGTQKWWEKWWETFSKLLMMYPLVIAILAMGKIAAWLTATSDVGVLGTSKAASIFSHFKYFGAEGDGSYQTTIAFFVVLVAYFGPFFFVPGMYKQGGAMFAKLGGAIQGAGSKLGRGAGNWSKEKVTKNAATLYGKGGNKYSRFLARGAARAGTGSITPPKFGGRSQTAALAQARLTKEEEDRKIDNSLIWTKIASMNDREKKDELRRLSVSTDRRTREAAVRTAFNLSMDDIFVRGPNSLDQTVGNSTLEQLINEQAAGDESFRNTLKTKRRDMFYTEPDGYDSRSWRNSVEKLGGTQLKELSNEAWNDRTFTDRINDEEIRLLREDTNAFASYSTEMKRALIHEYGRIGTRSGPPTAPP